VAFLKFSVGRFAGDSVTGEVFGHEDGGSVAGCCWENPG